MDHIQSSTRIIAVVLLSVLAFTSRTHAQSSQVGRCASCTPVGASGTCQGSLPVCVDNSSSGDNNLPCAELIPGAEAAYGNQMAARMSQDMMNSMPDWMRANQPAQPTTAAVSVPTDADVAAKQCRGDKPSKMCCGAKAFSSTSGSDGQASAAATATSTNSNPSSNTNSNSNSYMNAAGSSASDQSQSAKKQNAAGAVGASAAAVASATAGAVLLLQMV